MSIIYNDLSNIIGEYLKNETIVTSKINYKKCGFIGKYIESFVFKIKNDHINIDFAIADVNETSFSNNWRKLIKEETYTLYCDSHEGDKSIKTENGYIIFTLTENRYYKTIIKVKKEQCIQAIENIIEELEIAIDGVS